MTNFNYKISSPQTAFIVIFLIGALLSEYGIIEGAALLFALFAGISLYRMFSDRS